jgi:ABC-type antimicrobial peptide transport system permease subunit
MLVRSQSETPGLFANIRNSFVRSSEVVVYEPQTMDQVVAATLAARKFAMALLSSFAALALVLAAIGLYGVLSYLVGQRTQEIGVRMSLGAQRLDILRIVLGDAAQFTLLGLAIGLGAALALTRLMSSMLFGVKPTDPLTFVAVGAVLCCIALLACYLPARRATKVDPIVALRCE